MKQKTEWDMHGYDRWLDSNDEVVYEPECDLRWVSFTGMWVRKGNEWLDDLGKILGDQDETKD